jgi:hypothetical protein
VTTSIKIEGVSNQLTNIGVIVANNALIIQILSTLPNSWEVLASSLMYRTTMSSFIKLTTMILQEELCTEIKRT